MRTFAWVTLSGALVAAAWAGGCGSDTPADGGFGPPGGNGDAATGDGGGSFVDLDAGGTKRALTITPANPVLTVTAGAAAATQQFVANLSGSPVTANWSLDNIALGAIDSTGLFKPSGTVGGQATVAAQVGAVQGSTTVTVKLNVVENTGNIDAATITALKAGGTNDSAFAWLYPYDQTVFPRGLLPPTLQFGTGQAANAYYVHITTKNLEYTGYFPGNSPSRIALTPATWAIVTGSTGSNDPVKVEVSKISGGKVAGPIAQSWTVAQGTLKGTVYYNTYNSPAANNTGAVMRVKPGANADVLLKNVGCTVCHAVSANGGVLVTMGATGGGNEYGAGAKVDLTTNAITPRNDASYGFGGVYPDGSKLVSNAAVPNASNIPGVYGDRPTQLIDLATGNTIAATGLVKYMLMPSFSPDGKKLAFNDAQTKVGGNTLAVLDFNTATNTFSNPINMVTGAAGRYLGWPAFLPDTKSFVFGDVDGADYATWQNHHGDLHIIDLATKQRVALDAANGISGGKSYLPYGNADLALNYEPTTLPLAVGGYYWVVFTSRRQLGNMIAGGNPWSTTNRKKLWVVAIDINQTPGKDPSHPAFYLEGQEFGAGNMRGFWALDPCKQNGNACGGGDECCTGFCRQVTANGASSYSCVAPPTGCANEFEKCNTVADCCDGSSGGAALDCIGGFCATSRPK